MRGIEGRQNGEMIAQKSEMPEIIMLVNYESEHTNKVNVVFLK